MKRYFIVVILITILILSSTSLSVSKSVTFQGIEVLIGYSDAELNSKQDYKVMPLFLDFDFNIKPLVEEWGFNHSGLLQFQIEPFFGYVGQPEINLEVGTSFFIKVGLVPEYWEWQPYVKFGTGMVYMSQHTVDQSTQFNFISHIGLGAHYFFDVDNAFTMEYRYRHLSNASIKQPNSGIDSHFYLMGFKHFF